MILTSYDKLYKYELIIRRAAQKFDLDIAGISWQCWPYENNIICRVHIYSTTSLVTLYQVTKYVKDNLEPGSESVITITGQTLLLAPVLEKEEGRNGRLEDYTYTSRKWIHKEGKTSRS